MIVSVNGMEQHTSISLFQSSKPFRGRVCIETGTEGHKEYVGLAETGDNRSWSVPVGWTQP